MERASTNLDDPLEEMMTKNFEDHDDMGSIDSMNFEIIEQLDALFSEGIFWVSLAHAFQQLDFVNSRVCIMLRRFDDYRKCYFLSERITVPLSATNLRSVRSQQSQTVEKWPQPSFRITW